MTSDSLKTPNHTLRRRRRRRCGTARDACRGHRPFRIEPLEHRLLLSVAAIGSEDLFTASAFSGDAQRMTAELRYRFDGIPELEQWDEGYAVQLAGEQSWLSSGDPILPVRGATVLLPEGMEITSVEVTYLDVGLSIGEGVDSFATPAAVPFDEAYDPAEHGAATVAADALVEPMTASFGNQLLSGYRLGTLNVFPVVYDAVADTLVYYSDLAVTVTASAVPDDGSAPLRDSQADRARVAEMVMNPEALAGYDTTGDAASPETLLGDSSALPAAGGYQYVVITSGALESSFQPLVDEKLGRGISAGIVTTEYIYANYAGTETGDHADRIREFIADAYGNWGTQWVLLGGDVDVIPERGVFASSGSYSETELPTDMYYACLDGPWNGDGDALWGEYTDGRNGRDIDLMPEVYVGRAPVSDATEAANFVAKTVQYATTAHPNYDTAVWLGEKLDGSTWGGTSGSIIRDRTLPADWNVVERYDSDAAWSGSTFTADLNASPNLVNHLGHSSAVYNGRIYASKVAGLTNEHPYFVYSQGCDSGSFDTHDLAIAEQHVVAEHGAFGAVMNSRYGWYASGSSPAYSHYYALEFWDALFNEGLVQLGQANEDSKADNLWRVGATGAYRWIHFETNLFGDPELSFQLTGSSAPETPVARNDDYATSEDNTMAVAAAFGVLANDTADGGGGLTASLVGGTAHGTLTLSADGSFQYVPDRDYHGSDGFTYRAFDGQAYSDPATVALTVRSVNDTPSAGNDVYQMSAGATLDVGLPGVLANDTDADGDSLTAALAGGPAHGELVLSTGGSFRYTPDAGFSGTDSFTYVARDGTANSPAATVTIRVLAENSPPVAGNDSAVTNEDQPALIRNPANDYDPDGDPLETILVTQPGHGSAVVNPDQKITYVPSADFHGTDTFTYRVFDGQAFSGVATVTVTVKPVNDAPSAGDDSYELGRGTVLEAVAPGVLANDSDGDGDPLTAILSSGPSHGKLHFKADGSFRYTPDAGFTGTDGFTYLATDGQSGSQAATVTLVVTGATNSPPVAGSDSAMTDEDQPVLIRNPANDYDPDGDPLHTVLVTEPAHGWVVINPDQKITYYPDAGFNGTDTFTYRVFDGQAYSNVATVTVTVLPAHDGLSAYADSYEVLAGTTLEVGSPGLLANDTGIGGGGFGAVVVTVPGNGSLVLDADGSFQYTPAAGFSGVDTFTYVATDGKSESNVATVTLLVAADDNTPPVAGDDAAMTLQDQAVLIRNPANDYDADGDPLRVSLVVGPGHGTSIINPDQKITYIPDAGFHGTDVFTYRAFDGQAYSNVATVTITVNPVSGVSLDADGLHGVGAGTTLDVGLPRQPADGNSSRGDVGLTAGTTTGETWFANVGGGRRGAVDNVLARPQPNPEASGRYDAPTEAVDEVLARPGRSGWRDEAALAETGLYHRGTSRARGAAVDSVLADLDLGLPPAAPPGGCWR